MGVKLNIRKHTVVFSLLLIGLLVITGCGSKAEDTKAGDTKNTQENSEPITVGSILDVTGPINVYGITMNDATKLAVDDINKNGGVLGRQLKLASYDAQSNNEKYAQYSSQLILQDKAEIIMGGITSASREAVRPVIDRYKKLYFYNEQYEGGVADKYVFNTGVVPEQQLSTLVKWAAENKGPKMYVIAADYNYGRISAQWVGKYLEEVNGTLAGEEFIPMEVSDFSSTINKIQETKPDVVVSLLVGGNHIAFYRQFAAAGLKEKYQIISPSFGLGNEQVVLAPEEAEGIVVAFPYFQELDNSVNKKFVEEWHKVYGDDYSYITDSANAVWNGWHLWAMAVNKAGTLDQDEVMEVLESGLEYDSPSGKVTLDPKTHHLIQNVSVAKVNKNHGFDIIKTYEGVAPVWHQQVIDLIGKPDTNTQFMP